MTPYAQLLARPVDDDAIIRGLYHAIAKREHPDSAPTQPSSLWYAATDAYTAIKTVGARIAWEARLRIQSGICTKCRGYGVLGTRATRGGIRVCDLCEGEGRAL